MTIYVNIISFSQIVNLRSFIALLIPFFTLHFQSDIGSGRINNERSQKTEIVTQLGRRLHMQPFILHQGGTPQNVNISPSDSFRSYPEKYRLSTNPSLSYWLLKKC